jgi:hypothetical protein
MKKAIAPGACRKQQIIMSKHYTRAIMHMLLAGLIAGAAVGPSNAFAQAEPQVLGKTIGEWSAKWWQWALAIPTPINPMVDDSGKYSHVGQQGPVWFLAGVWGGGTAERVCTVPRGKHILFSIANSVWINTPPNGDDPNNTETDYRQFANDGLPPSIGGELEATLDENPIIFNPKTPIIRSQSPVFRAKFPDDNVFGLAADTLTGYPIVSDGFWVMLPPLSPGSHELHFKAGDQQNVRYKLTVR